MLAYHLGFDFANIFTWYKPTYDPELRHKSPGEVLLKYLLEYSFAKQKEEFDFTRGIEQFKLRFANKTRANYIAFYKKDSNYYKQILKIKIKTHPTLENLVRKFLKIV